MWVMFIDILSELPWEQVKAVISEISKIASAIVVTESLSPALLPWPRDFESENHLRRSAGLACCEDFRQKLHVYRHKIAATNRRPAQCRASSRELFDALSPN